MLNLTASTTSDSDLSGQVERHLVIQRRAVLLTDRHWSGRGMSLIWSAARRLRPYWQVLDDKPSRQAEWRDAAIGQGLVRTGILRYVNPLTLAYAAKYGTPCAFTSTEPVIVNLDGLTRTTTSHAWSYFAPLLRQASFVLALGHLHELHKIRELVELIHPLESCVVASDAHINGRLV